MSEYPHPLELFAGGLPPFSMFCGQVEQLSEIVSAYPEPELEGERILNPAAELAVIGLVSYFEAFCKHQFAALVNICPPLLERFSDRRQQASIRLNDLISVGDQFHKSIGFLVAEQYDFGSGKLINGLFTDLLTVTPLGTKEVERFDQLLNDRHLLVHHAGVYTLRYAKERLLPTDLRKRIFMDSLVVQREDFSEWTNFLLRCAVKIVEATVHAIRAFVEEKKPSLDTYKIDAIKYLLIDISHGWAEVQQMSGDA